MNARPGAGPSTVVASLAALLDRAFFAGEDVSPRQARRIDSTLTAALGSIEWMLDRPRSDESCEAADLVLARALFDLVLDVRHARCQRFAARAVGGLLLHRVAAEFGLDGEVGPLARVLAALTVLPGDDHGDAHDARPDPAWPLEAWIDATLRDPSGRLALLAEAADAELHLPVISIELGERAEVQFIPVLRHGRPAVAAYTSPDRMIHHARAAGVEVPGLVFRGRELAGVIPVGHGLMLNPGSILGLALSEAEVRGLAGGTPGAVA